MILNFNFEILKNRFYSENYRNLNLELTTEEKNVVKEVLELVNIDIKENINFIFKHEIAPLILNLIKSEKNINWFEPENCKTYIRYTKYHMGKEVFTLRSVLSYYIKEVEIEKIFWKHIEESIYRNVDIKSLENPNIKNRLNSIFFENKMKMEMDLFKTLRSYYVHKLSAKIFDIEVLKILTNENSKTDNNLLEQLKNEIFTNKNKTITFFFSDFDSNCLGYYKINSKNEIIEKESFVSDLEKDMIRIINHDGVLIIDQESGLKISNEPPYNVRHGYLINTGKLMPLPKIILEKIYCYDSLTGKYVKNTIFKEKSI